MKKTVRIVLYVLSLMTVIFVFAAIVFAGRNSQNVPTTAVDGETHMTEQQENEKEAEETSVTEVPSEKLESTEMAEQALEQESEKESQAAETEQAGDTTILFTGDVLFANAFQAGYDANGITGVVSEELLAELNSADILMVNNEFPFSTRGEQMQDKQFTFRCDPIYTKALTELGVDVVSLANNHTLDYGKEALQDTFTALDSEGILYGGAGNSVERAEEIQVIEVNGKKFGFLAVSRVIPTASWKVEQSQPGIFSCYDETRLLELVEEGKKECDFLAVYPHWGVEYEAYPEDYQKKIAKECIAAGADIVVGSHTHCLQGVEVFDGKPVFYSLGNFIFGQTIDRSVIVKVTVTAEGEMMCCLLPVSATGGVTSLAKGAVGEDILNYMSSISSVQICADGTVQ